MKVFISQPMKGKTKEEIEADRAYACQLLKLDGHEVMTGYVVNPPKTKNEACGAWDRPSKLSPAVTLCTTSENATKTRNCPGDALLKFIAPVPMASPCFTGKKACAGFAPQV